MENIIMIFDYEHFDCYETNEIIPYILLDNEQSHDTRTIQKPVRF